MPLSQPTRNYIQAIETVSRSLTTADAFKMLYANNGALIFTVEAGVFGEGTQVSLCDYDGGLPVFAAGAGVILNSGGGLGPSAQFTVASIVRVPVALQAGADEEFIVIGSV